MVGWLESNLGLMEFALTDADDIMMEIWNERGHDGFIYCKVVFFSLGRGEGGRVLEHPTACHVRIQ